MIPNTELGAALAGWLAANPNRRILARQAPDGPNPDNLADGTVYLEVLDGGALPADANLQAAYNARLAGSAPERGFDYAGESVPWTPPDCAVVAEAEGVVEAGRLVAGKLLRLPFSNGAVVTLSPASAPAFFAAFHAAAATTLLIDDPGA